MIIEESRLLWFVLITSFIEVHCFPTYRTQQIHSFQSRASSSLNSENDGRNPGKRYNGRKDDNSEMQKRLESSLSNLFDMSRGSSSKSDVEIPSTQAQFDEELKSGFESLGFSKDDNAPILSEDMYLNSDKYFDEDGSLKGSQNSSNERMQELALQIMNDSPTLPVDEESLSTQSKEELDGIISDETLLQSMSQAKENAMDSEAIHKLIFENEKGFLEQTEQFRGSLLSEDRKKDQAKAKEAAALRRGAQYRKDQTESLSKLLKDMDDFEKDISAKEKARQLATHQSKDIEAGAISNKLDINSNLIACSRCKCLLSPEEIVIERKRGRNEMTCRLCQVEEKRSKHGSPYLMGRNDKNNAPPRKGYIEPPQSKALRRRIQEIRKIGPLNENVNYDMFVRDDDTPTMFEMSKRTVKDSEAWREQFTTAMMRGKRQNLESPLNKTIPPKTSQDVRKTTEKGANAPEQIPVSRIPRTPLDTEVYSQPNSMTNHNQYAKRLQDLRTKDRMFRSKEIYDAHLKSALYRQRAIEYTGIYTKRTLAENTSNKEAAVPTTIKESDEESKVQMMTARTKKVIQTKDMEIVQLKKEMESLKSTLNDYKGQIEKSSKKIKALQSMNAVLQKNMNKRIKKSSTNNSKVEEEGITMRNEVGEGVVRIMQSKSQPKYGNANDKSKVSQKMKGFSDEDDLLTNGS